MSRRRSFANVPQLESAPLKVIVGKGSATRTFFLHKERATNFSATIAAALKSEWKEDVSGTVTLPEDDPELFEIFAGFIYTGGVHCAKQDDLQNTKDTGRARLADLWVFGDKLQAPEFKDAVVDATAESVESRGKYPPKMHEISYANSLTPSGMRRLLIDMCIGAGRMVASRMLSVAPRGMSFSSMSLRSCMGSTGTDAQTPLSRMEARASITITEARSHATRPCFRS